MSTYYVSTSGSDSNPGSSGSPWLTIQHAADVMVAGDTAIIAAGTYAETVATKHNGTSGSRITFQATSTSAVVRAFSVTHAYQTIDGFTLNGIGLPLPYSAEIYVGSGGNYLTVSGNTFDSSPTDDYQLQLVSQAIVGLTAQNNRFMNGHNTAVTLFGSGHVVSHNYFENPNGADAIRLCSSNTTIADNEFRDWSKDNPTGNHPDLIQGFVYEDDEYAIDNVIERNLFIDCAVSQIGIATDDAGLGHIGNWIFRNNIYVNVDSAFDSYIRDVKFYNNLFYQCATNTAHTINFMAQTGARYAFAVADVNVGASTITLSETPDFVTGSKIRFYNTPPAPLINFRHVTPSDTYYARLVGLTFSVHPTAADAAADTNRIAFTNAGSDTLPMGVSKYGARGHGKNARVYNNAFIECSTLPGTATRGWYMFETGVEGCTADNNLVIGTPNTAGTTKTGFPDPHGINGQDPQIVSIGSENFHLQATSPCIGAASIQSGFTDDYFGTSRGAEWDIGPAEFENDTSEPPSPHGRRGRGIRLMAARI